MNTIRIITTILVLLLLSSCGLLNSDRDTDPIAGKEDLYIGIYQIGFEDTWFYPCYNQEESWLFSEVSDTTFYTTLNENRNGLDPIYMEVRGIPSKKGEYQGFFAIHERSFEVKELIEIREAGNDNTDCNIQGTTGQ